LDISREVVEAYYVLSTDDWRYPHSFGTKVEGTVVVWAEKSEGYNAD